MKRYAYAWLTAGFFLVSIVLHWVFGWYAFADEQQAHGEVATIGPYLMEMGRDTFENWQSEFLQVFVFIVLNFVWMTDIPHNINLTGPWLVSAKAAQDDNDIIAKGLRSFPFIDAINPK